MNRFITTRILRLLLATPAGADISKAVAE